MEKNKILLISSLVVMLNTTVLANVYPSEILELEDKQKIIKTYNLSSDEEADEIPTSSFEMYGNTYNLVDITKVEDKEVDKKEVIEEIEVVTKTNHWKDVHEQYQTTIEYNKDGYIGTLTLDRDNIKTAPSGYVKKSFEVTTTRSYPGLSSQDTSTIPKTITHNGSSYNFRDVSWSKSLSDNVEYMDVPVFYTATVTYVGVGYSSNATGYTSIGTYTGEVEKVTDQSTVYSAIFVNNTPIDENITIVDTNIEDNANTVDDKEVVATVDIDNKKSNKLLFGVVGVVLVAVSGFIFAKLRKRNDDDYEDLDEDADDYDYESEE